jgi:hypothetical protein
VGLAQEPLAETWVIRQIRRHDLERDIAAQPKLPGAVNGTHAASADHGVQPVSGELHIDRNAGPPRHATIFARIC